MGKKRAIGWRARIGGAVLLAGIAAGGWWWWQAQHWRPDPGEFPVQGVLVGDRDGRPDFRGFAAIGAGFAYLEASEGASGRSKTLARNMREARRAGLNFGVVHSYDPCTPAERQSANFMTIVPREGAPLPPAVALVETAEDCVQPVVDQAVESELTTFLNQIEGHAGQPAILLVSSQFQETYAIAGRIERNLWLERDWFQPDYAGRPWTLWTANSRYRNEASEEPVRWVVLQP